MTHPFFLPLSLFLCPFLLPLDSRARKNAENSASEENIRQTAAPFHKIGEKAKEIQKVLAELASDHLQLQANTSNLKGEVMKVRGKQKERENENKRPHHSPSIKATHRKYQK